MPSLLPSFPYPSAGDGFWSPVTATLNWCEEVRWVELPFPLDTHGGRLITPTKGLLRNDILGGDHQHSDEHVFRLSCNQRHPELPTERPRPSMSGCIFQYAVHRHWEHLVPYDIEL